MITARRKRDPLRSAAFGLAVLCGCAMGTIALVVVPWPWDFIAAIVISFTVGMGSCFILLKVQRWQGERRMLAAQMRRILLRAEALPRMNENDEDLGAELHNLARYITVYNGIMEMADELDARYFGMRTSNVD